MIKLFIQQCFRCGQIPKLMSNFVYIYFKSDKICLPVIYKQIQAKSRFQEPFTLNQEFIFMLIFGNIIGITCGRKFDSSREYSIVKLKGFVRVSGVFPSLGPISQFR